MDKKQLRQVDVLSKCYWYILLYNQLQLHLYLHVTICLII